MNDNKKQVSIGKRDYQPFDIVDPNAEVYALAGIGLEERARLLKKAWQAAEELLDATRVDRASFRGEFLDERETPDYTARARGIEQAQSLAGVDKAKEMKPVVNITISTPSWAIQGSPKQKPKVIEAEKNTQ